jgi:hypothetical protein
VHNPVLVAGADSLLRRGVPGDRRIPLSQPERALQVRVIEHRRATTRPGDVQARDARVFQAQVSSQLMCGREHRGRASGPLHLVRGAGAARGNGCRL